MSDALPSSVRLESRRLLELPDAAGVLIRCESGSLWVTMDNDPRDIVLEAGQVFETTEHRRALVYALENSHVGLAAAGPSPAPTARWRPDAAGLALRLS